MLLSYFPGEAVGFLGVQIKIVHSWASEPIVHVITKKNQ